MLCVQNVCVEPILIFDRIFVMMLVSVTRGPDHIQFLLYTITKSVFILANSAGPDETSRFAASHLDLLCICSFFSCI